MCALSILCLFKASEGSKGAGKGGYIEGRLCKAGVKLSIPERGTMGNLGERGVLEVEGVLGVPKAGLATACYGGRVYCSHVGGQGD